MIKAMRLFDSVMILMAYVMIVAAGVSSLNGPTEESTRLFAAGAATGFIALDIMRTRHGH